MELAIPLVAVGGLYIASKQRKENFESSKLPNVNLKDKNYPSDIAESEAELTSKLSTVNKYDTPQAYTDKYFIPHYNNESRERYSFM